MQHPDYLILDLEQITDWIAYHQLRPIGETRADLRAGIVAATMANCHRAKHSRAFSPSDFMPFYRPAPQTFEQQRMVLQQILGVEDATKEKSVKIG